MVHKLYFNDYVQYFYLFSSTIKFKLSETYVQFVVN
jgi:hypothetical protein